MLHGTAQLFLLGQACNSLLVRPTTTRRFSLIHRVSKLTDPICGKRKSYEADTPKTMCLAISHSVLENTFARAMNWLGSKQSWAQNCCLKHSREFVSLPMPIYVKLSADKRALSANYLPCFSPSCSCDGCCVRVAVTIAPSGRSPSPGTPIGRAGRRVSPNRCLRMFRGRGHRGASRGARKSTVSSK